MGDGHTHWTLNGVSPQPEAERPSGPCTVSLTRAQVTLVRASVPNFSGTRVVTGRNHRATPVTRQVGLGLGKGFFGSGRGLRG